MSNSFWPHELVHQAPLSPGISQSRILEWVAIPYPGIEPWSPALQSLQSEPLGKRYCSLLLFSLLNRVQSLWPHGLQHASLPILQGVSLYFKEFPCISRSLLKLASIESALPSNHLVLCHPFFLPSIFSHQGLFTVSWLFESGGQSIRALASASVLPMNIQCWFLLGLAGLISLLSKGLSRVSCTLPFLFPSSHICTWLREKP